MQALEFREEALRRVWRFHRTDGSEICWLLQLAPNGMVVNYSCPNETFWAIDGDTLLLLDGERRPTTRFVLRDCVEDRMALVGSFLLDPGYPEIHLLTSWRAFDPALPAAHGFHMRVNQSGRPRLVVTLNGRGRCFGDNEGDTDFEMKSVGVRVDADMIAVAEKDTRVAWYGDKVAALVERIAPIARSYPTVAVAGLSAGGLGAILLAEALGEALPGSRICSVAVNAQTSLHDEDMAEMYEMPQWCLPPVIASDAREAVPDRLRSAASCVSAARGSAVSHTLIYDSGNPAETFFAMKLRDAPRCTLLGHDLGQPHSDSCDTLYRSGIVTEAIGRELDRLATTSSRPPGWFRVQMAQSRSHEKR